MSKRPKILFIAPLPPPVHGSAMVSELIKNSAIINQKFDCDFVNLSLSRRMDEIQKFSIFKVFRFIGIYFSIFFKLLFNHYDLCYAAIAVFGTPFLKDSLVVLLCKLFGNKVLIHQHNKGMDEYANKPVYRTIYRLVYSNSTVALLSWKLYDDISKIVRKDQVVILPNGIQTVVENTDFRKSRTNGLCRFLYLSNLIPSKGCNDLLDACSILKERGLKYECDFIGGDCPEQSGEMFEALIKSKNLHDCVKYHGKKYGVEKNEFFSSASVFVFPTYYPQECFPLVLLEAMQCELPCISTTEGGIPDIIDANCGIIVEKHSPLLLADALQFMIEHPSERALMGIEARKRYLDNFTEVQFEKSLCDILSKCVID